MLTFLHAADFHLDSPFSALTDLQAMERFRESRELLGRLSDYVNENHIDLVLLAGDLFDTASASRDTVEHLARALGSMKARVFAAPGNRDWYGPRSPWRTVSWPENVTVFRKNAMTAAEVPEWNLTVYGAAFIGPEQTTSLLRGFSVPRGGQTRDNRIPDGKTIGSQIPDRRTKGNQIPDGRTDGSQIPDGRISIGLLHGELTSRESAYHPIRSEDIEKSGLHYLALGHDHRRSEAKRFGKTLCAWPGCIEGHSFEEPGEKGFFQGNIGAAGVEKLEFVPFATRRYEVLPVDVTDRDPLSAVEAALGSSMGSGAERNLYRILCTGETGAEGVDLRRLRDALSGRVYGLELRDYTCLRQDVWARSGEDTLRGLFLRELREKLDSTEDELSRRRITLAARMGLAALDHRELSGVQASLHS